MTCVSQGCIITSIDTTMKDGAKTSPYFKTPTSTSRKSQSQAIRSPYFLQSPSSILGSILSLGPLVHTWYNSNSNSNINSNNKINSNNDSSNRTTMETSCTYTARVNICHNVTKSDYSSEISRGRIIPCQVCQEAVTEILSQFSHCPKMQNLDLELKQTVPTTTSVPTTTTMTTGTATYINEIKTTTSTTLTPTINVGYDNYSKKNSCIELIGAQIEQYARHLCQYGCYLRAFAPCREWSALHTIISTETDESVETLLQSWTCKLLPPPPSSFSSWETGYEKVSTQNVCQGEKQTLKSDCKTTTTATTPDSSSSSSGKKRGYAEMNETTKNIENEYIIHRPTTGNNDNRRSCSRPELPRVVFVNHVNGKKCNSIPETLRAIGIDIAEGAVKWRKDEINDLDTKCSPCKSTSTTESNIVQFRKFNRLCSEFFNDKDMIETQSGNHPTRITTMSSNLGLLEELFWNDPWKLLLSTILLNRTRRIQVDVVMDEFLKHWPTPEATILADADEMSKIIAPLGLKHRRAAGIIQFSKEFLCLIATKEQQKSKHNNPLENAERNNNNSIKNGIDNNYKTKLEAFMFTRDEVMNLYNCGAYAADAYEIFIKQDWSTVQPLDYALQAYVEWKRSLERKSCVKRR